jgi:hypothetical protein
MREAPAREQNRSVVRVFTVTVKYAGQPERQAGSYPSRRLAAREAALLSAVVDARGQRPVGVGILHQRPLGERQVGRRMV